MMAHFIFCLAALLSYQIIRVAAFTLNAKTNVAVYWGQGQYQARLIETCKNPNVDVVIVSFVNVFPDSGPGGYPGTNFGNACGASTYKHNGKQTALLSSCPDIGPDITACQKTYKKKVLLSLGGGYPTDYYIGSDASAVSFATFLWNAFGPVTKAWTNAKGPRPFGNAVVDGFDFDIESQASPAPKYKGQTVSDYQTRGYVKMIQTFRQKLFSKDTSKKYFISGSPQCVIPDAHFAKAVQTVWFDFLFIQFYNTPICSARAGVNYIEGASSIDISYSTWSRISFFNKNVKIFIGLPGSTSASNSYDYYLPAKEADLLIRKYYANGYFGGIMLWEATYAMNNVVCGKNYPTWIKKLLQSVQSGTQLNTTTNDCPNPKIPCGTCPANAVSTDGRCGPNFGTTCSGSTFGSCCSTDGYCGTGSQCSIACDSQFSDCGSTSKLKRQNGDAALSAGASLPANMSSPGAAVASDTITVATSEEPTTTSLEVSSSVVADTPGDPTADGPGLLTFHIFETATPFSLSAAEPSATVSTNSVPSTVETTSSEAGTTTSFESLSTAESLTALAAMPETTSIEPPPTQSTTIESSASETPSPEVPGSAVNTSTRKVTIFTTVFSTITQSAQVHVVTTVIPVATSTITLTKTIASNGAHDVTAHPTTTDGVDSPAEATVENTMTYFSPDVEATATSFSSVPGLETAAPEAATETTATSLLNKPHVESTATLVKVGQLGGDGGFGSLDPTQLNDGEAQAIEQTATIFDVEYHTTIVSLAYATTSDDGLYSPHAAEATAAAAAGLDSGLQGVAEGAARVTRTTKVVSYETVRRVVTVTPMTRTEKSTTTVVVEVTVAPVARAKAKDGKGGNSVKSTKAGKAKTSVTSKGKQPVKATGTAKATGTRPLGSTGAGGRLSPTDGASSWGLLMVGLLAVLVCL